MLEKKGTKNDYPSLYDAFELGDRVKRRYTNDKGETKEYKGIILAIYDDAIEIYWDTENGKYRPEDMDIAFTNCSVDEIFSGDKYYTPIERE